MRLKHLIPLLLTAAVLLSGPVLAAEILYFTNGTSMPVKSHAVDGDMILVVLEEAGQMAFPMEQVEKIETSYGQVYPSRGKRTANQMVGGQGTVTGVRPGRYNRDRWEMTGLPQQAPADTDARGVAVQRPHYRANQPAATRIATTGGRGLVDRPVTTSAENGGVVGTSRLGQHYVMPPKNRSGRTPIGIAPAMGQNTSAAAPKPADDE